MKVAMRKDECAGTAEGETPRNEDQSRRAEVIFLNPGDGEGARISATLRQDHGVRQVETTAALLASLAMRGADLLLLDRSSMPGEDPNELCRVIRRTSAVAIIILVDPDQDDDRVKALEAGADDSFHRLVGARELSARIMSVLRRAALGGALMTGGPKLRFEGFMLDPLKRMLTDAKGEKVELTAAEFDLLYAFCRNYGRPLSRRTLLTYTSVGAARPTERSIDVHVSRLRAKLEHDPHHPLLIRTVRLGGYVFTPRVEAATAL